MERSFQKTNISQTPGPTDYSLEGLQIDNREIKVGGKLPLNKRNIFLDIHRKTAFGTKEKTFVLSGLEKQYDEVYEPMMSTWHEGPAKYNIRDCIDPLASFHAKKITSNVTNHSFTVAPRPFMVQKA